MKKIISFVIAAAMLIAAFAVIPSVSAKEFPDVNSGHWAYEDIKELSEAGAINGYEDGTFRPDGTITHEEFLKMVVALITNNNVTPVPADYEVVETNDSSNPKFWTNHWTAWAQPYLTKAKELGVVADGSQADREKVATLLKCYDEAIHGYVAEDDASAETDINLVIDFDDTAHIAPDTPITREEMARIVTRALYLIPDSLQHQTDKLNNPYSNAYREVKIGETKSHGIMYGRLLYLPDANNVDAMYWRDIIVAYLEGIVCGDESYMFNPKSNLTRAEAAAVINRLTNKGKRISSDTLNDLRDAGNAAETDAVNILVGKDTMFYGDKAHDAFRYTDETLKMALRRRIVDNPRYDIEWALQKAEGKPYYDLFKDTIDDTESLKSTMRKRVENTPEYLGEVENQLKYVESEFNYNLLKGIVDDIKAGK